MRHARRRGMALIVVMVLTLMVALGAYGFMAHMQSEYQSAKSAKEQAAAKQAAFSGLEYSLSLIDLPITKRTSLGRLDDNPELFQAIAVESTEGSQTDETPTWSFCLISPERTRSDASNENDRGMNSRRRSSSNRSRSDDLVQEHYRFGLENESAKVNLSILPLWERIQPGTAARLLASLPGSDESSIRLALQELGLFNDINQQRSSRRGSMRNAPSTTSRLQNSSDITINLSRRLWDAGDCNGNYRIDPFEMILLQQEASAGERSRNLRMTSGDRNTSNMAIGWNRYLTWHSGIRNANAAGTPRIDLNQTDLSALHQQLSAVWAPECANFVIAFRQFGPATATNRSSEEQSARDWTPNYQTPARHPLTSPLDLIDTFVEIPKENGKTARMKSPFSAEISSGSDYLERLLDDVTTTPSPVLIGTIDLMEAPREVMLAVPGMTAIVADRIIASRAKFPFESHPKSLAWLLTERIVTPQSLRMIFPWIAMRSDVYRTQSIGFRDLQSHVYRCTAILDARTLPASYHSVETWHTWDKGFDLESLQGDANR